MSDVEVVALWAGLLGSVVGTVLSVVAIIFSVHVDRRSSKISDHTIQSLQKIESTVERLSSDTRELIKAGWDKMLVGVDRNSSPPPMSEAPAKEIAAGIAAELRAELGSIGSHDEGASTPEQKSDIERMLKNLEASLVAQLRTVPVEGKPSETFDRTMATVSGLTSWAYALLRGVSRAHLTLPEYRRLSESRLAEELNELRSTGLLAPVVHREGGEAVPCYYMPPGISRMVIAALQLLPEPPRHIREEVRSILQSIGYPQEVTRRPNAPRADAAKTLDSRPEKKPDPDRKPET